MADAAPWDRYTAGDASALTATEFDEGLAAVTSLPEHAGDFKVPSLRNAGLRPRLMHTVEMNALAAAIPSYFDTIPSPDRDKIPGFGNYAFNFTGNDRATLAVFIGRGLTDPRVRDEAYPFDRPTLASEQPGRTGNPPASAKRPPR